MSDAYNVMYDKDAYNLKYIDLLKSHHEWIDFAFVDFKNSAVGQELKELAKSSFQTRLNELLEAREALTRTLITYQEEQKKQQEKEEDLPF